MNNYIKLVVFSALLCVVFVAGFAIAWMRYNYLIKKKDSQLKKYIQYYNILNEWLRIKNSEMTIENRFQEIGLKKIAIYGFGEIGERLIEELNNTGVEVCYAIDKTINSSMRTIQVYSMDKELPYVDAIVITPMFAYDAISTELRKKVDYKIISIEDIMLKWEDGSVG